MDLLISCRISLRRRLFALTFVSSLKPQSCFRMKRMSTVASRTSNQASAPPIPRPSASLVIINERNEVLMVQRNPQARSFAGVTVFPGGNLDKKQDSSLRITAIREAFEESGLLIARPSDNLARIPSDQVLDEARFEVHGQKTTFEQFMKGNHLTADTDSLLPFTTWITPKEAPRRFYTQFYVTFLPGTSASGFMAGSKQERLPKPDGGQEVITARFVRPEDALAEFNAQKITFMPPQFYILYTLSNILRNHTTTFEERVAVQRLSSGPFGRMTLNPRRLIQPEGSPFTVLTYEGDETRGGSPGRLHRAVVKMGKGGITTAITLHRNFDIFTEIEPHAFDISAKL
ncbi:NUDIX domain-containing protein [Lentinula raphanica]|nr:NUDIX domain-containing protein [Lentinula raphanica]KAJ3968360.1 NUDIX domain-containing protein [Lentinula raphanica]